MPFDRTQFKNIFLLIFLYLGLLSGCAISPPVQEMSNARQSIRAAVDANAENLAPELLSEAKQRLHSARSELDAGEYERARVLALEAKHLALKARKTAINKSQK